MTYPRASRTKALLPGLMLALQGSLCIAVSAGAQSAQPVEERKGRLITAMGQPSLWRYFIAGDAGLNPIESRQAAGSLSLGFERALFNPLLSAASLTGEYFMGLRGQAGGEVGVRAGLELPLLRLGGGIQYEYRGDKVRPYVMLRHPIGRGGVFWPGGQVRLLWTPGPDAGLSGGVTVPLANPFAGRTRPRQVKALVPLPIAADPPTRAVLTAETRASLDRADSLALLLARLHMPLLGPPTATAVGAGPVALALQNVKRDLVRSSNDGALAPGGAPVAAVRAYHAEMVRAFGASALDARISAQKFAQVARDALLEEVLLPYNRMLGRQKESDTFDQLAARARVAFVRALVLTDRMDREGISSAEATFSGLLEVVRHVSRQQVNAWRDDRMAFLPLQLGLLPEDHDSQAEIAALVGRAIESPFTSGNRAAYVVDEQFEYELLRMIQDTRSYHVLWTHDFRGTDDGGAPDAVAFRTVLDGYLDALADRVEAYDTDGALPVYIIMIDQWFYQANRGRLWLSLLEDPLRATVKLPEGMEDWTAKLQAAQTRLRKAVANSRLLQAEAREYGNDWLLNRVRVQINVTNPADPTFWNEELVPWIGLPDAMIRDHRKITFFDVDDQDPSRGRAMFTGMGVGEHYNGPTWDDRALLVEGPALVGLRVALRELMEHQGFEKDEIPYPLWDRRALALAAPSAAVADASATGRGGLMTQAHNQIGYGDKRATLLKATLYSLMPAGSVVKAPDSLWNFPLWSSLLSGVALRGGRVMIVAPSFTNAPAQVFGSLELARNTLGQLLRAGQELAEPIAQVGGLLKVGMYHPTASTGDIPGKARQVAATFRSTPWLRSLYGNAIDDAGLLQLADSLDRTGFRSSYLEGEALDAPKLHLKTHLFSSPEGWDPMVRLPSSRTLITTYLSARAGQLAKQGQERDLRAMQNALAPTLDTLNAALNRSLSNEERERAAWFLLVGSHNQNYRSAMLDGEVVVAMAGRESLVSVADFAVVLGLSEWLETPEALDQHIPPFGGFMRGVGLWARIIF